MKIQCDVCDKAPATVICCADEAALCSRCDVKVHAANKLASKHQRLMLQDLPNKLPTCDICRDKSAFIFCVEDRALFCKDCDEQIHSCNTMAKNHQRFLATGIRVGALGSNCDQKDNLKIQRETMNPKQKLQHIAQKTPTNHLSGSITSSSWDVDEFLQFSEYESNNKDPQLEFNDEFEWLREMNLFGAQNEEAFAAAEVPQLPVVSQTTSYRSNKFYGASKKRKIERQEEEEEEEEEDFFMVPDLG